MQSFAPIRRLKSPLAAISLLAACLGLCPNLAAQRQHSPTDFVLPPDAIADPALNHSPAPHPPSPQQPVPPQQQSGPQAYLPPPASPPHRPDVTFNQGLLAITADNCSLNEILRAVSRKTGMVITGGVADERVYGHYGPDTPGPVLAALLDGTGSNMLFLREQNDHPSQLILTTRNGGPTPPNPNASREREEEERSFQLQAPPRPDQSQPPPQQNPTPPAGITPSTEPNTTTDQQSPNGVKTPQQIMDQLMKLRQSPSNTQTNTQTSPQ
jgi:hypothetical protein